MTVKALKKKSNMARTSKSRGKSSFKMKSGNTTSFKMMGSSPTKFTNYSTGEDLNPNLPGIIQNMGAMGVSGDIMEQIIKNKAKKEIEVEDAKIDEGKKIDTKTEIEKNVPEVEDVKKIKPSKTNMDKLRAKQKRSSKGQSEYQYRQTKEYKDSKKGLKDLTGTIDTDPVDLTKPQTGPRETGGGGASFTPEKSELSFGDVFAKEHKIQGPGGEFEYKGEKYTTDRADDKNYGKYKHTDKIIENFKQPEVKKVEEVKPVKEELEKKGFDFNKKGFDFNKTNDYSFNITDEYGNPIPKKSPYKKYGKTAKGKRGFKMRRK